MLPRPLNEHGHLPGATWHVVQTRCPLLGLLLREVVEGRGGNCTMSAPQRPQRGGVAARKPGGVCEGMCLGRDHQHEQRSDANGFKTGTD